MERPVEFRALGSIELRIGGVEAAQVLAQPKRFSLFAFLALAPQRTFRRDILVALLWPERDSAHARHSLRQTLYYLRRHLDDSLFVIRGDEVGIESSRLWCDVTELDEAWARGDLECVADLFRGDLLEGFHPTDAGNEFEFWLERERFRLRERVGEAHRRLAEAAHARGDLDGAIRWTMARREAHPGDEQALLALMTLLDEAGKREIALESYRLFVEQTGYEAPPEIEALAQSLQAEAERGWSARLVRPPSPPGSLIGRRRLIEQVRECLHTGSRLLTLTGPGGVGKTRLAIEVAREAGGAFDGGAAWASLAAVRDPARVPDAVAEAVGLEPRPAGVDEARLMSWLEHRELLLVLDNLEHLLESAPFIARLTRECPGVTVLATSRSPLKVRGEQELEVPPLTLPDRDRRLGGELPFDSEAVALFVDRVRALSPSFRLTEENADPVIEICRRLDGLPLAIELAAPRTKIMSSAALARRLQSQLPLLTGGSRDLPERQRALHDTISWSVDLLDPAERELLFGLSVFVGGCDLDAVESVAGAVAGPDGNVLDLLTALIDTSLIRSTNGADRETRFVMLESIREYGRAELERAGRAEAWQEAHARHFAAWAEAGCHKHYCSPGESRWFDRMTESHENLDAAMEWSLSRGESECAARIAASATHFWCVRGRLAEGRDWLDRILASELRLPPDLRVRALAAAAHLRTYQGLWDEAISLHEEVVRHRRASGDRRAMVAPLHNLAETQREAGRLAEARATYVEALAIANETGDDLNASLVLTGLGSVDVLEGRLAEGRVSLEDGLARARKTEQEGQVAIVLRELALLARAEGELDAARHLLERSAEMLEGLDRGGDLGGAIEALGELQLPSEPAAARVLFARALAIYRDGGYLWGTARVLARFARLALADGHADRCLELMGGVDALSPAEAARGTDTIEGARSALGPATSEACWTAGRVMSLEQLQRLVDESIPALQISISPADPGHAQGARASRRAGRPARTSAAAGSGGAPAGSG